MGGAVECDRHVSMLTPQRCGRGLYESYLTRMGPPACRKLDLALEKNPQTEAPNSVLASCINQILSDSWREHLSHTSIPFVELSHVLERCGRGLYESYLTRMGPPACRKLDLAFEKTPQTQ